MKNLVLLISLLLVVKLATANLAQRTCTFKGNFDYPMNDLYGYEQKVPTANDCCTLCIGRADCVAWTWMKYDNWSYGKCFLKSAISEPRYNTDFNGPFFISATVA